MSRRARALHSTFYLVWSVSRSEFGMGRSAFGVRRFLLLGSRGPVFPPQPKKKEREKRNEPSVAVLLVDRPLAAQLTPEDKPKRAQRYDGDRHTRGPARLGRSERLRFNRDRIQDAQTIAE